MKFNHVVAAVDADFLIFACDIIVNHQCWPIQGIKEAIYRDLLEK